MSERLTSAMLVSALVRRAGLEGGFTAVERRGDETSGIILLRCLDRGHFIGLYERVSDFTGACRLEPCGPKPGSGFDSGANSDEDEMIAYLARRQRADPDLWIVELDVPDAERFAAETIC